MAGEINRNFGEPIQREVGQISYNIADYRRNNAFEGRIRDGRKALIKIYSVGTPIKKIRELNTLLYLLQVERHYGIIQYICYEQDLYHTYIVFEYCLATLKTAVMEGMFGFDNISIADMQMYFLQLASGISFLHENGIQHCNIKPENILCRKICSLVISNFEWSQRDSNDRASYESHDILCLGYVFYFMLTREEVTGENLVRDPVPVDVGAKLHGCFNQQEQHIASMATDLVSKMIDSNQMKAYEIREQPFLWRNEARKNFFRKIGNLVQDKKHPITEELERNRSKIFNGDWMSRLDSVVQSDVRGFKDAKTELRGLLRVIRNKIEHFEKIEKPELRQIYLGSSNGVVEYYMRCFPELLLYTYSIYREKEDIEFIENFGNIDLL